MEASLQRYRRDRRKILHFILSSDLVNELRPKSPSDAELDLLSADYVLHCVHSGGVVDIAEATNKYYEESTYPVTILSQVQNSYFLISDPDLAGSPPRREPPPIFMNHTVNHASHSSVHLDSLIGENIPINGDERGVKNPAPKVSSLKLVENVGFPSLGLPILNTDLNFSGDTFSLPTLVAYLSCRLMWTAPGVAHTAVQSCINNQATDIGCPVLDYPALNRFYCFCSSLNFELQPQ